VTPYYEEAGITIFHGDCREILPQLGRFDLLLTDPPYGIFGYDAASRHDAANGWKQYGVTSWDKEPVSKEHLDVCLASADKAIVWGGNYFELPPSMGWLVWNKGQRAFSLADGELAWTSERQALRIFDYSRSEALLDGKQHPTQKPIALMKWCIGRMGAVCSLVDPFMGSGTSLVAAKDLGILATGIELEERYCEIAANRLRQSVLNFEAVS
jgi:site-specific DNA-methyltransferase (adenine-specific)